MSQLMWDVLWERRLDPFLKAAGSDRDAYAWFSRTAAASFEVFGHLEVLLRNAPDRQKK